MTLSGCTAVKGNVDGVADLDDDGGQTNNRLVMLGSGTSGLFGVIAAKSLRGGAGGPGRFALSGKSGALKRKTG